MKKIEIIIVCLFYLGWFACVFLAKTAHPEVSIAFPLALILFLLFKKQVSLKLFSMALAITGLGIVFDSLHIYFGLVALPRSPFFFIPIWLVSIWLLFSVSIVKLAPRIHPPFWLAAGLGFFIGPLSYKSGEVFNVLSFTSPITFLTYGMFWALIFPSILSLAKRVS